MAALPREHGQVDWAHFGKLRSGRAERPLMAFVMVLAYSRRVFVRFYLGQCLENFQRGHVAAFGAWGGLPRVLVYDNLKGAVLGRRGDGAIWTTSMPGPKPGATAKPASGRGRTTGRKR